MKRVALMLVTIILGFTVVFSGCLLLLQDQMIYFPRQYSRADIYRAEQHDRTSLLEYETSEGSQTVFLVRPRDEDLERPEFVWFIFGGNATVALDLLDYFDGFPEDGHAFVLMDFPGYGQSEGTPAGATILDSALRARELAAEEFGFDAEELSARLGAVGHSLGGAAALEFARETDARAVVTISPFTSMNDMAWRQAGPFAVLLKRKHRFDNVAVLEMLKERERPPFVAVVHGEHDPIVPVSMGRRLRDQFPDLVRYEEIERGDHNWILDSGRSEIFALMREGAAQAAEAGRDG